MDDNSFVFTSCFNCGKDCLDHHEVYDEKDFCCSRCSKAYQILKSRHLLDYYHFNDTPGKSLPAKGTELLFPDDPEAILTLVDYEDGEFTIVTFKIPSIHSSSCVWLLERLNYLNREIIHTKVDVLKKELTVTFRHAEFSVRNLAELLYSVNYQPLIDSKSEKEGLVVWLANLLTKIVAVFGRQKALRSPVQIVSAD